MHIESVVTADTSLSESLASLFRAALWTDSDTLAVRYGSLTSRERQVMSAVIAGRLNKQIAHHLGIAQITVKVHRAQVMRKMKAGSLPELVTMAMGLGAGLITKETRVS